MIKKFTFDQFMTLEHSVTVFNELTNQCLGVDRLDGAVALRDEAGQHVTGWVTRDQLLHFMSTFVLGYQTKESQEQVH